MNKAEEGEGSVEFCRGARNVEEDIVGGWRPVDGDAVARQPNDGVGTTDGRTAAAAEGGREGGGISIRESSIISERKDGQTMATEETMASGGPCSFLNMSFPLASQQPLLPPHILVCAVHCEKMDEYPRSCVGGGWWVATERTTTTRRKNKGGECVFSISVLPEFYFTTASIHPSLAPL